jgi:hypothetical protein
VSVLSTALIINEVFPNPNLGNEWVEIRYLGEEIINPNDYYNFTLSDEKRVIYSFQGDEAWSGNFLIIEVTGLNNDQDSVILKNAEAIVIDEMNYTSSEKDLSWSRTNPDQSIFTLGQASPLAENLIITPTIIPSPSPSPTALPTVITPTPSTNNHQNSSDDETDNIQSDIDVEKKVSQTLDTSNRSLSQTDLSQICFTNYQNYQNLQTTYSQDKQFAQTRLMFLGQEILKRAVIDAIIGSSLLVIAAILLSYETRTKN